MRPEKNIVFPEIGKKAKKGKTSKKLSAVRMMQAKKKEIEEVSKAKSYFKVINKLIR